MSTRAKYLLLIALTAATVCVTYCVLGIVGAIRTFPERHARSCLITITQLADRTIDEAIPRGKYSDAIDAAEYIKRYYPVGWVLPEDHPFAEEYEAERQRQIARIRYALENAVAGGDPTVWERWSEAIEGP